MYKLSLSFIIYVIVNLTYICIFFSNFRVETIDGTADAGSDYKPLKEYVEFAPNESLREVYVEIVDDDIWEPDEFFFIKLYLPEEKKQSNVVIGKVSINQITIINDDGKTIDIDDSELSRVKIYMGNTTN